MRRAIKRRLNPDELWSYAVKALSSRAYSSGDLRRKLAERAEGAQDADSTILRLKECGYLNDSRFAENFASARLENQGLGKTRVLRDLRQRRVPGTLAQNAVQQIYAETDEIQLIESFIERKIHPKESFADQKDLATAYRRLIRAGFRSGNIIQVLKRLSKDQEALDRFEPPEEDSME